MDRLQKDRVLERVDAWALGREFDWGFGLLEKFWWPNSPKEEFRTRLFRTRQQAREARETCRYKDARVVKVVVTIESA